MGIAIRAESAQQSWTDEEIIDRVLAGDTALYELLVRRYNQRLYRVVRAVLREDNLTEDVMQEAYIRAFQHLRQFEGRASFSTWLSRIAVHEAFAKLQQKKRLDQYDFDQDEKAVQGTVMTETPETSAATWETRELLEKAILALPREYRVVVVMRDVEEMTTAETASALELSEEAVKVRLHRAHAKMRNYFCETLGASSTSSFQFHAARCDRVAAFVMEAIRRR